MDTSLENSYSQDELWRRSIPAQVFLNHFFGLHRHIAHRRRDDEMNQLFRFRQFVPKLTPVQAETAKRMLIQAWNTEYALRKTAENGDETFHRNALYWTFPQAYYSIFFGVSAFLAVQGRSVPNEAIARMRIASLVTNDWYPAPLAFAATGHPGHFSFAALPAGDGIPSLQLIDVPHEWQAQIGQFLRTTRTQRVQAARRRLQADPTKAIRTKTGKVSTRFGPQEWTQVAQKVSPTTFLDLFARLKISSTHREIARFVEADIDFRLFHNCLLETVRYVNSIHEHYVARALGESVYAAFRTNLPLYLQESAAAKSPTWAEVRPIDYLKPAWQTGT